jgi:hypothetical protein
MHDLADPLDAALGILRVAVPNAPVQTFDLSDNRRLCQGLRMKSCVGIASGSLAIQPGA